MSLPARQNIPLAPFEYRLIYSEAVHMLVLCDKLLKIVSKKDDNPPLVHDLKLSIEQLKAVVLTYESFA